MPPYLITASTSTGTIERGLLQINQLNLLMDSAHGSTMSEGDLIIDEGLIQSRDRMIPSITTIDLDGLLLLPLKLQEDTKDGCGGQVWPAGTVLAKYMVRKYSHEPLMKNMFVCSQTLSLREPRRRTADFLQN